MRDSDQQLDMEQYPEVEPDSEALAQWLRAAAEADEEQLSTLDDAWEAGLERLRAEHTAQLNLDSVTSPVGPGGAAIVDATARFGARRQVVVSRALAAAAAEGQRRPAGQLDSGDGRFVTVYEENEDGHLVVTVTGPAEFTELVSIAWTVQRDAQAKTSPGHREVLVTPLAPRAASSVAVYDLGAVRDVASVTLEAAGPAEPSEISEGTVRAALQQAVPYGNAVRAWRRYRGQSGTPAWLQALIEELLSDITDR